MPAIGELLAGKYRLDGPIGEGGFAVVFRGTDVTIDRPVAVKILKPGEQGYSPTKVARFKREAHALASLLDPHTLRLFDFGRTEAGMFFMVFELLGGRDLSELLDVSGPMRPEAVIHVLRQVLQSLNEAHQAGLVHRDIKPANIRVYEYAGDALRVKVMDFGIARLTDDDAPSLTATGSVVGTLVYMAPEQMQGDPAMPASDIFSLGLVAYEMLTGDLRGLRQSLHTRGLPPLLVAPRLGEVIGRMVARNLADRFQSASAVLNALDALDRAPPIEPDTVPVPVITPPPAPAPVRSQLPAILAAAGLVLALGLALTIGQEEEEVPQTRDSTRLRNALVAPTGPAPTPQSDTGVDLARVRELPPGGSPGCGEPPPVEPGDSTPLKEVGFRVYLPKTYDAYRVYPLVVVFHTDATSARRELKQMRLTDLADAEDFVIVAPIGGDLVAWPDGVDPKDVKRTVDTMRDLTCLDDRVFVLGHGAGGGPASHVSCKDWVTAVATTSYRATSGGPLCAVPKPYLHFAPLRSEHLPVDGGPGCKQMNSVISLAAQETMWLERNRCEKASVQTAEHEHGVCYSWRCDQAFTSCHVEGGHGWPGSERRMFDQITGCDGTPTKFEYGPMIWSFFESTTASK